MDKPPTPYWSQVFHTSQCWSKVVPKNKSDVGNNNTNTRKGEAAKGVFGDKDKDKYKRGVVWRGGHRGVIGRKWHIRGGKIRGDSGNGWHKLQRKG